MNKKSHILKLKWKIQTPNFLWLKSWLLTMLKTLEDAKSFTYNITQVC